MSFNISLFLVAELLVRLSQRMWGFFLHLYLVAFSPEQSVLQPFIRIPASGEASRTS